MTELRALAGRIGQRLPAATILLFGSHAKGTATARSDVDLFVVLETTLPFRARRSLLEPYLAGLLARVDVHVYTPEEASAAAAEAHSFVASVYKTGVVLFGDLDRPPPTNNSDLPP